MTSEIEYMCNNCGHEGITPRAVPDVPELVRYSAVKRYGREDVMEKDEHGEYVRYDQAAEIIAAKDARIAELEADNKRLRGALVMIARIELSFPSEFRDIARAALGEVKP